MKHRHLYLIGNFERCQEIMEALANWLNSLLWDWFFTGTFDDRYWNIGLIGIKHYFWAFLIKISEKYGGYPYFVVFFEKQGTRPIPHIHALIKWNLVNPEKINREDCFKMWLEKFGINKILPYEKEKGACFYLAKLICKPENLVDWDICLTLDDWLEIKQGYLAYKKSFFSTGGF